MLTRAVPLEQAPAPFDVSVDELDAEPDETDCATQASFHVLPYNAESISAGVRDELVVPLMVHE